MSERLHVSASIYDELGPADGPPLLCSNSLGTTREIWSRQLPAWTTRFRVIRYEHRGHGSAAAPGGPYEIEDLALDALDVLDRLGIERAHVCGLSLGGMVGMWLAANRPERVDKLVLCCTSARLGPPEMWAERAATVRREGTAAIVDAVLARWLTPEFRADQPAAAAELADMLSSTSATGYAECCGAIERMDQEEDIRRIAAPTLVLAGRQDPASPVEQSELIADRIPDSRLEVLDPAAHMANLEQPEAVADAVVSHLLG